MKRFIMALDQGTTSSRCIIFNKNGTIVSSAQKEFTQIYPKPGWVEQDAVEIWASQYSVAIEAMAKAHLSSEDIAAIGITNQRETTIIWDKNTGKPIYNAIVWQCRRTAEFCDKLKEEGYEDTIKNKTGLIVDAYFSASKIKWILDNVQGAREKAEKGELLFGTVDSWIIWNLTKGALHITDYSNASRTMIFNINELKWDEELLNLFNIPYNMLPEVKSSSCLYGYTAKGILGEKPIAISGIAGDQQAALFGQTCFEEGCAKNTYGTGCFLLMNTGEKAVHSKNGLITTIAWEINGKVNYALEGSVFIAGASVQWLRDEMRMIKSGEETERYAEAVENTNGVYVVPAFSGLGAPYWDPYARGMVIGITRGTKKEHFIRAVLESIAYQTNDVLKAMEADSKLKLKELKVDGGASANNFLMQFQSNILGVKVLRPEVIETTALGAAYLAGLAIGYWKDYEDISKNWNLSKVFNNKFENDYREELLKCWHRAVERSMNWQQ